jgi:adenylosuccinate synthase
MSAGLFDNGLGVARAKSLEVIGRKKAYVHVWEVCSVPTELHDENTERGLRKICIEFGSYPIGRPMAVCAGWIMVIALNMPAYQWFVIYWL